MYNSFQCDIYRENASNFIVIISQIVNAQVILFVSYAFGIQINHHLSEYQKWGPNIGYLIASEARARASFMIFQIVSEFTFKGLF